MIKVGKMQLTERKIQYSLQNYLIKRGHYVVIPNVSYSWLNWEADLISVTSSFIMYEFEIKISYSDFKNDFSKRKHRDLKRCNHGKKNTGSTRIPNYFSYVAPLESMPICIPDYAGLIQIVQIKKNNWGRKEFLYFDEIKKPKKLHGLKQTEKSVNKMLRTLMWKYWGIVNKGEF